MEYIVIFVALLFIVLLCLPSKTKGKKPTSKKGGRKPKEVGKIYKTTDGYLSNNPANKKKRNVVVVEQRKKDGAVAVSKIRSKKGNNEKNYVDGLTLLPTEHKGITKPSVVETRVIFGVKRGGKHTPIFASDIEKTRDRLTKKEMRKLNKQKGGKSTQNRRTFRKTRKKWRNGFTKKE